MSHFAWEFLRRNSDYHNNYSALWGRYNNAERRTLSSCKSYKDALEEFLQGFPDANLYQYWLCHPIVLLQKKWGFVTSVTDDFLDDGPAPWHPNPIDDKTINLWFEAASSPPMGMGGFDFFKFATLRSTFLTKKYNLRVAEEEELSAVAASINYNLIAVEFDLSKPLKPQLARASVALKRLQESKPDGTTKANRQKLIEYLRVIDGLSSGSSNREIMRVVYSNDQERDPLKAFNHAQTAGKRLVHGGYRGLAAAEK